MSLQKIIIFIAKNYYDLGINEYSFFLKWKTQRNAITMTMNISSINKLKIKKRCWDIPLETAKINERIFATSVLNERKFLFFTPDKIVFISGIPEPDASRLIARMKTCESNAIAVLSKTQIHIPDIPEPDAVTSTTLTKMIFLKKKVNEKHTIHRIILKANLIK